LSWLALVSVQDTLTFWHKLGFEPVVADADQQPVLATYTGRHVIVFAGGRLIPENPLNIKLMPCQDGMFLP
jgi:hypothetical protein